jgi:CO/xanthine dehydrogenase FAD-binding subunit
MPVVREVRGDAVGEDVREALKDAEFTDDLHGTAAYRRHLAEVLAQRALARTS